MLQSNAETLTSFSLPYSRTERIPAFVAFFLVVFGLVWGGIPTTALVKSLLSGGLTFEKLPLLLFTTIGTGIVLLGLHFLVRKKEITLTEREVSVRTRSLLGVRTWTEPLSNYEGVRGYTVTRSRGKSHYLVGVLELYHPEKAKRIQLVEGLPPRRLRAELEEVSRTLGLAALEEVDGRLVKRNPEDLDKSVRELAREQKLQVDFDPSVEVPEALDLQVDRESAALIITTKKKRLPLVGMLIGLLVPGTFMILGFAVKEIPLVFGIFGAVFETLIIGGLIWEAVTRERIRVSPEGVTLWTLTPWGERDGKEIPAEEIEDVRVGKAQSGIYGLLLVRDEGDVLVGRYLPKEALSYLRDCILAVLTR